jgi:benzoyl-CoA reductase/2-hydroxyglutaryl-CoA dehydratase subunit BcrC/BadD/HgdB
MKEEGVGGDGAPVIKKLEATRSMRDLMAAYFRELEQAAEGMGKVAWCTSVGPAELLRAMGFSVYFPENHGAMLGASRLASDLIPTANALGYSPDICSYLTSDVGAWLRKTTPLTKAFGMRGVPRPDVLVYNTNQCRDVQDWFAFYQRELGVPLVGIQTPRSIGEVTRDHVDTLVAQMRAMIPRLEAVAGRRFDIDRLRETVASSYRCSLAWGRVLGSARHRPSPFTFFDGTIHMGPAVVLRGDDRAVQYYELLAAELETRVAGGVAAVEGETHRLYWEGMPVWGKLREHAQTLGAGRACVVASTYCNSWVFEALAEPDPFEGMARAYAELFIVRDEPFKEAYLARMAKEYAIDGFIFHDAKTCPNNSNNRYGMPGRLSSRLGLPHIVIHGDLNDLRLYSEEQANTLFEALIEQL